MGESAFQKESFDSFYRTVANGSVPQSRQIDVGHHLVEIFARQILRRTRRQMQRGRLDGDRADCVVWAVVAAGFIDWQKLHEPETGLRGPIDKLAQRRDIADPEIVSPAQTKKRRENPGDLFFGR